MIRRWLAALLALGCRSVRIAGNVVDQVRLGEGNPYLAVGIASNLGFDRLDVLDNSVVPAPGKADPAGGLTTDLDVSIGLLISEVPGEDQLFVVDEKLYLVSTTHVTQLSPSGPRLVTAVRGNRLDATGDGRTALVATKGSTTFADNHCTQVPATPGAPGVALVAVELAVDTLVLSGNQVVAPRSDKSVAVDASVAGGTITGQPAITAIGNITSGQIRVNGGPLGAPWAPLNVRTS